MKITVKVEKEVDIKTLHVSAGVRYWEDTTVNGEDDDEGNLIPCREGKLWRPIIDIETGQILNWTKGVTAEVHYKVCDAGNYELKDEECNTVLTKEGYVPAIMYPKEQGFGDYIIMDINEDGFIQDWECDLSGFTEDED